MISDSGQYYVVAIKTSVDPQAIFMPNNFGGKTIQTTQQASTELAKLLVVGSGAFYIVCLTKEVSQENYMKISLFKIIPPENYAHNCFPENIFTFNGAAKPQLFNAKKKFFNGCHGVRFRRCKYNFLGHQQTWQKIKATEVAYEIQV